jgi:hypothetical protein
VLFGERCKSFEADSPAHFGIGWSGAAYDKSLIVDGCLWLCCHDDYLPTLLPLLDVAHLAIMVGISRTQSQRGQSTTLRSKPCSISGIVEMAQKAENSRFVFRDLSPTVSPA